MNFHPKCYYRQVFCAKLGIAVHECIRETLSRSSCYIFTVLCLSLIHLVQVKRIV